MIAGRNGYIEILLLKDIECVQQQIAEAQTDDEREVLSKKLKELGLKYDIQVEARRNLMGFSR